MEETPWLAFRGVIRPHLGRRHFSHDPFTDGLFGFCCDCLEPNFLNRVRRLFLDLLLTHFVVKWCKSDLLELVSRALLAAQTKGKASAQRMETAPASRRENTCHTRTPFISRSWWDCWLQFIRLLKRTTLPVWPTNIFQFRRCFHLRNNITIFVVVSTVLFFGFIGTFFVLFYMKLDQVRLHGNLFEYFDEALQNFRAEMVWGKTSETVQFARSSSQCTNLLLAPVFCWSC